METPNVPVEVVEFERELVELEKRLDNNRNPFASVSNSVYEYNSKVSKKRKPAANSNPSESYSNRSLSIGTPKKIGRPRKNLNKNLAGYQIHLNLDILIFLKF